MENLTKHQFVLLILLISFVTSMATGIVTVSLMDQAPANVTQTINRVVERTIEKVVSPSSTSTQIVKETIILNSDDQVVTAVEKNSKSIIRIYRASDNPSDSNPIVLIGLGVVLTDDGIVAADNGIVSSGGSYFTASESGKLYNMSVLRSSSGERIALLKIKQDEKEPLSFSKTKISLNDLKLGQAVVYIGGEKKNVVSTGIVSTLNTKEVRVDSGSTSTTPQTKIIISSIETNISSSFISGGLLLNLSGEVVGVKSTYLERTDLFVPSSYINDVFLAWTESQKKSD